MVQESGTGPRRGRPGHDQAAVLRAAIALFNERGFDATSMADIARELGVGKSAVFHHVASKDALLAAALDEALTGLAAAVEAAELDSGTSATDRLTATITESVRILVAHLPAVTLLLRVRGNSAVELAALARRREIDDRLAAIVRDAVQEGSLRGDVEPQLISRLLFGMVNSLVEWYRPDGAIDADELAATVTDVALRGLVPRD